MGYFSEVTKGQSTCNSVFVYDHNKFVVETQTHSPLAEARFAMSTYKFDLFTFCCRSTPGRHRHIGALRNTYFRLVDKMGQKGFETEKRMAGIG